MPKTTEPAKPSHDFLGLTAGAMGCEPNITPAMKPPVSEATTQSINTTIDAAPEANGVSTRESIAANVPNKGIHVSTKIPIDISRR